MPFCYHVCVCGGGGGESAQQTALARQFLAACELISYTHLCYGTLLHCDLTPPP